MVVERVYVFVIYYVCVNSEGFTIMYLYAWIECAALLSQCSEYMLVVSLTLLV